MSFLSTHSRSARRHISCAGCGARITLTDHIRKDGDAFVHVRCPDAGAPPAAAQDSPTRRS